jgi:putative hemolysin
MYRKIGVLIAVMGLLALIVSGCQQKEAEAGLPNPASVYCEEQGGRLEIREEENGQRGVCIFDDGSECDEWAYFRGECQPGDSLLAPAAAPEVPVTPAGGGWLTYQNEEPAYSFLYPADAAIVPGDDPLQSLTIQGPVVADDHWPMLTISAPRDREEYRPPEGADLEQWLTDHNLLMTGEQQPPAETRQADVTIAGTTAIHTRFERSPQSYAYDKYFLAHAGQLYVITILHTGDKEDWELYNHFLESFQFEG